MNTDPNARVAAVEAENRKLKSELAKLRAQIAGDQIAELPAESLKVLQYVARNPGRDRFSIGGDCSLPDGDTLRELQKLLLAKFISKKGRDEFWHPERAGLAYLDRRGLL